MRKFALIHYGTHEIYGLCFVAFELRKKGHLFRWFDGESKDVVDDIVEWAPDFICLSPLSAFFNSIIELTRKIKERSPNIRSVFGGLHVLAVPEIASLKEVDIVVRGPIYGTIDAIISNKAGKIIRGKPVSPKDIEPAKREYYKEIPRIGDKHVKIIMSHFGCVYNCSYCSASNVRNEFGLKNYKKHWLTRRPLDSVINEAKIFLEYPTSEVELGDDDLLYRSDVDNWLSDFIDAWKSEINLPVFGNVTPFSVLKASHNSLKKLAGLVNNVCMGLQAVEKDTIKLFNRQSQTRDLFKKAVEKLDAFGIKIKIDIIVGNPVKDPVGDAIETIKFAQSINNHHMIVTVFPLMLYPGTSLTKWCEENKIAFNDECRFDWYSGIGSIKFDPDTEKKIKNLAKMGSFFISHKVSEEWIRALIEMDINEDAARQIANCNYRDSLVCHGENDKNIAKIMKTVKLYY